jgi:arsenite oxidase small subunit
VSAGRGPLWREEISIFSADERYVNRRQFAKFLVLTSLGMFVGNLWILVKGWLTKKPVYPLRAVARLSEIPVGGVRIFSYPTAADPCILVRAGENRLAAYSQKCTHLSCAVYYQHEESRFECPCHEGYFSVADGRVLQGPPQRPLPRILLEQKGDTVYAIGVDLAEA